MFSNIELNNVTYYYSCSKFITTDFQQQKGNPWARLLALNVYLCKSIATVDVTACCITVVKSIYSNGKHTVAGINRNNVTNIF